MKNTLPPLLLALALGACVQPGVTANRTVESDKAPVIEVSRLTHEVRFGPGNELSPAQADALDQYLGTIGLAYGDRVSVDDPSSLGAMERRSAIAEVVARHGLLVDGTTPVTAGAVSPSAVRVVVTRSRASIPNCPDWSRPSEYEVEAATSSNYGCATRSNLAEMIADPNDLIVGKSYNGADGRTASAAINGGGSNGGGNASAAAAAPPSAAAAAGVSLPTPTLGGSGN